MKQNKLTNSIVSSLLLCTLLLLTLTGATFAWFTDNAKVNTSKVTGKTSVESVKLELSTKGGADFKGEEVCDLLQVNTASRTSLKPVSTVDLKEFVYCASTVDGYTALFTCVEDENYYYHGRIYLRATAEGAMKDASVSLYFDESAEAGGSIVKADDSNSGILTAARVGFLLDEENPLLMTLSDDTLTDTERHANTRVNGVTYTDPVVLTWDKDAVATATDPAVPYTQYLASATNGVVSNKPLFTLKTNQIYTLDVYFYLEGCDPDCTEAISFNASDLHLAFYGIVS